MMRSLFASVLITASVPCASAPLEILPSGHPVAEVTLEAEPGYRFVIDTAASSSAVTPGLRAKRPSIFGNGGQAQLAGATGQVGISTLVVPAISVAGKSYAKHTVAALPPSPVDKLGVDGIIGADILSHHVFDLDLANRSWNLTESVDAGFLSSAPRPVPFSYSLGRAPVIQVMIEGKPFNAIVDTGAKSTIMNWAAAEALGRKKDTTLENGQAVGGATGSSANVKSTEIAGLTIGTVVRPTLPARIVDLPVFAASGFRQSDPVILLGIDAFANGRLIVDYPGMRVFYTNDSGTKKPGETIASARP